MEKHSIEAELRSETGNLFLVLFMEEEMSQGLLKWIHRLSKNFSIQMLSLI
jgi:hypothetical protein